MIAIIGLIVLTAAVIVGVVAVLSHYGSGQEAGRGLRRTRRETAAVRQDRDPI